MDSFGSILRLQRRDAKIIYKVTFKTGFIDDINSYFQPVNMTRIYACGETTDRVGFFAMTNDGQFKFFYQINGAGANDKCRGINYNYIK